MRRIAMHLIYISVFLFQFSALAQDETEKGMALPEVEVITEQLPEAEVKPPQADKIQIKLADGKVFELEAKPNVEDMKAALGLKLPEKVRKEILAKGGSIEEENPLAAYETLSDERKAKFLEVRLNFLSSAARVLNRAKFAAGAGSLVGTAFSFVKVKVQKLRGKTVEPTPGPANFRDRSDKAVASILKSIDYKLWTQAPLVIDSNEVGLSLSAGIIAETGMGRKGFGGLQELGISLGYNKTSRAFVFEIFHNGEGFDNTRAAVSVLGLVGKAGLVISRRNGAENVKGYSFYPPAVPGYSTSSSDYFAAGISSGIGVPPPPFADLLTYTNKFERTSLIRITISPIVKGFVRIHIGDLRAPVRLVVMPVVDVYRAITDKVVRFAGRRSCQAVFL